MPSRTSRRLLTTAAALVAMLAAPTAIATAAPARAAKPRKPRTPKVSAKLYNVATPNAGLNDIVAGPDGALWFTEKSADKIGRITTDGRISEYPITVTDDSGDRMVTPRELVASGGSLFVLMDFGYILRISPADPAHPTVFYAPPGYEWPDELAAAAGGGLWFSDAIDERVVHLAANGALAGSYSGDVDYGPFVGGPGGSVWFAPPGSSGSSYIREIQASGQAGSVAVARPDLEEIFSLAFDRSGKVWFTKYTGGSWIIDPSGGTVGWVDGGGHAHQIDLGGDYVPRSLVAGPGGAMWFATKHGIGRMTTRGHDFSAWSLAPYHADQITVGRDGAIWAIDPGANRIGRVGVTKPARVSAPRQRLRKVAKHRRLRVRCKMRSAGRCKVEAQVPRKRARKLGLKRGRRGEPVTLARASKRFKRAGRHTLKLKLSRREARALGHAHRLTVGLTATASAANSIPATDSAKLRLRR